MVDRRFAAPGAESLSIVEPSPRTVEGIPAAEVRRGWPSDQYLELPDWKRVGICCSGGGIRSASYCLGALQVLREEKVYPNADHIACVSGGGYMAIAHAVLVSESLKRGTTLDPLDSEKDLFDGLAPWARLSPEERNLRDHSSYLAPGTAGKLWLAINLFYGMGRHLVPFATALYLLAAAYGVALGRWIGPTIRGAEHKAVTFSFVAYIVAGLAGLAGGCLRLRGIVQSRDRPNGEWLAALQAATTFLLGLAVTVAVLLIGVPALLIALHQHPPRGWVTGSVAGGSLGASLAAAFAARREFMGIGKRVAKIAIPILTSLIGPLTLVVPFLAVTYWNVQRTNSFWALPFGLAFGSVTLLMVSWFFDERTPNMHRFYRERLSTAFVGYRRRAPAASGGPEFRYEQPEWRDPVLLSEVKSGVANAKLPNLIVCAAVNVSGDDVPPGRLAGSFTFEKDFCGGPLTGYIETAVLEEMAGGGVITLPAMMAISGAAVSPSMGKMTKPGLRLLMALFDVRLGVWLPNPAKIVGSAHCYEVRSRRSERAKRAESATPGESAEPVEPGGTETDKSKKGVPERRRSVLSHIEERAKQPGTLYTFREAFGLADLRKDFVYVTDGGHWDNLGLVELLRRGCGQIVCLDASGGRLGQFWTLAEAIGLARTELGVEIEIKLDPLTPDDGGVSVRDYVEGKIKYPNGTTGILVYARAAMPKDAPEDCRSYRERNRKFPNDPTSDQLFNDLKFESYRALGAHAARGCVRALNGWRKKKSLEWE